jgi:hypothetical protein
MKIKITILALITFYTAYTNAGDTIKQIRYERDRTYQKQYDKIFENGIKTGTCIGVGIGCTLGIATFILLNAPEYKPSILFMPPVLLTMICGVSGQVIGGFVGSTRAGCYAAVRCICPVRHPQKEHIA